MIHDMVETGISEALGSQVVAHKFVAVDCVENLSKFDVHEAQYQPTGERRVKVSVPDTETTDPEPLTLDGKNWRQELIKATLEQATPPGGVMFAKAFKESAAVKELAPAWYQGALDYLKIGVSEFMTELAVNLPKAAWAWVKSWWA